MTSRWTIALAAVLLTAGCGSPTLWARYQAERQFWHARRAVGRIQVNPELARPRDFDRAIAEFRSVVDRFPPAAWGTPDRLRDPRAADVAAISGQAWLAIGRLEESRGEVARALEIYRQAGQDLAAIPSVRLAALLAEASALERSGDPAAAGAVQDAIAREFAPVDPGSGELVTPAIEAPLRAAAAYRAGGQHEAADAVLDRAETTFTVEAARLQGQPAAPELWMRIARQRIARGLPDSLERALDAYRLALAERGAKKLRPALVLAMAEACLEGGRPDSALTYARWAAAEFPYETRIQARALEGRIWESVNVDSAIVSYDRFLDEFRRSGERFLMVKFRRAELLEEQGRWELARSEYRSLASASGTHELAFQASERIVAHHAMLGEKELARLEAERALETFRQLLTTVRDEDTLMRIRQARARVLLAIERWADAFAALNDLWSRYGDLKLGVEAGFRAAEVAERQLDDVEGARRLYQELSTHGGTTEEQEVAKRELERLRRERG